ncbi:hypothetical protein ACQ4PT_040614 [Festuca glaucescens]
MVRPPPCRPRPPSRTPAAPPLPPNPVGRALPPAPPTSSPDSGEILPPSRTSLRRPVRLPRAPDRGGAPRPDLRRRPAVGSEPPPRPPPASHTATRTSSSFSPASRDHPRRPVDCGAHHRPPCSKRVRPKSPKMNLLVRAVFDDSPSDADEEMAVESLIEMQANVQPCKPTDVCWQNIAAESSLPVKARDRPTAPARQSCLSSFQSVPLSHHEEMKNPLGDSETINFQKEDSASGHVKVMSYDETDGNSNICVACGTPGTLRSCDGKGCQSRYHISCLYPSLEYLSPGIWFCTSCTNKRFHFGIHSIVDGIESVWDVKDALRECKIASITLLSMRIWRMSIIVGFQKVISMSRLEVLIFFPCLTRGIILKRQFGRRNGLSHTAC